MIIRQPLVRSAEILLNRLGLSYGHLLGLRFAFNVFLASTIVWFTLRWISDTTPIWAIASMVSASEPLPEDGRRMFWSRIANVLVGCVIGFCLLLIGNQGDWMIPFALALTVLVSSYVIRIKTMWRQAPITAAIVIAAGISNGSRLAGIRSGLHQVAEVIFGCVVGLLVSWLMSKIWLIQPKDGNR